MKDTRKKSLKYAPLSALVAAMMGAGSAHALFGIGDVVTDPGLTAVAAETKIQQAVQFAQSLQNQINQLQLAIQNTMALANPIFQPLGSALRTAQNLYWTGQSLMWRAENIGPQLYAMNPGYYGYSGIINTMGRGGPTLDSLFRKWSDQRDETVRTALKGAGAQIDDAQKSQDVLGKLVTQSSAIGGQLAAQQAGNQIAAHQVQETQSLRSLMAQNMIMHAEKIAQDNARLAFEDAATANFMRSDVYITKGKGY